MARSVEERFWSFVQKTIGCWSWQGNRTPQGYGLFWEGGRQLRAHRFSYELHRGKIPLDMEIDHLCRNRACVNPDHLEVVTRQEHINRSPGFGGVVGDGATRGVSKDRKTWEARITINHRQVHIGSYLTRDEAAEAYNRRALQERGSLAFLNKVPAGIEPIPQTPSGSRQKEGSRRSRARAEAKRCVEEGRR